MTKPSLQQDPDKTASYIPSLDGLRAISILIVFTAHVGFSHIVPGGFGVTVFFFLSGYLITTLLTREWNQYGSIALKEFYLRRIVRLGPPIVVTLLCSGLLLSVNWVEGNFDPMTVLSQIFFFYNYYSLSGQDVQVASGLGVLWSLAVEEHFYLIWPALFILLAREVIGIRTLLALLLAILIWRTVRYYGLGADEWTIYISTDTRFDSLLFGCLLASLSWRGVTNRIFPVSTIVMAIYMVTALGVLLLCFAFRDDSFRSTLRYSLQGLALMPIFHYAVIHPKSLLFGPLNWKPIRKLGQWSYTIYLGHFVIINGLVYNGIADFGEPLLVLWAGVLSIAYAIVVYKWAEKPFIPLRKRLVGHARKSEATT